MRDRILGTSLNTIAAKNTATIVDVVDLCVTLIDADTLSRRPRIIFGDDVDTFRRTGGRAEETGNTLFLAAFVDVQQVLATIARLQRHRLFRILDGPLLFRNVRERDAHSLDDRLG